MKKAIAALKNRLLDPGRDFQERLFLLLTIIAEIAIFLVFIGDVITHENIVECAFLLGILIVSPFITFYAINNGKVQLGGGIIATGIIFMVLPTTFYFGGGLTGGSNIWFAFSYLYIGLILVGALRTVMLTLLTILIFVEYAVDYFFPDLIAAHDRSMWYADSLISVVLVGFVVYIMIWFLNRLFTEENRHVREQAQEIENLNKAQNRFFSSMSHEIRTPINTIIGLNEMILREDVSDEVIQDAENIQAASRMLLSLINDILDMSKIESGKMDIIRAPYHVGDMLSEIVNMIWIRANSKGLEFNIDVDPNIPLRLNSDEVRIKQILINLLNNAVKYTNEGRVSLSVSLSAVENGQALVTYSVEDTGIGIRKESIPHLFDAFKRVDEEQNKYIEGTGLGLSIVKQLTDLLGGTIAVNSIYTKGSTFVVTIRQDIVDDTQLGKFDPGINRGVHDRPMYHQSFEAPEAKVLIVDDNSANLMVVVKFLRDTLVQTDTAVSAEQALEQTLVKKYDVILMDHLMPGMDGIECLHAIREQAGGLNKDTPVIALTANAGSENQALYKREGFAAYLVKPVDAALMEHIILGLLPEDLVRITGNVLNPRNAPEIVRETSQKVPLMITTDSVCDLPPEMLAKYQIRQIPYKVHVQNGTFADGIEADSDVIIRFLEDRNIEAQSEAPDITDYESFFSEHLTRAEQIIHLSMASHSSNAFDHALEASKAFANVHVVDSGHLSSGLGLMAIEAANETDAGMPDIDTIMRKLDKAKNKVQTSFIVESTEYLYRGGKISERVHRLCSALMVHPVIALKDSSMRVAGIILGTRERTCNVYIKKALRDPGKIDKSVLFITYAGMKASEIEKVKEKALSIARFEHVYTQKASPAVSINCGAGTFGLIFARK